MQIRMNESKISMFPDYTIFYTENVNNSKKQLELINKFSKLAGYKRNMQKSNIFIYQQ